MRVDVDEKQWFFGTEDVYGQQATEKVAANLCVETGNEERLAHGDGIGAGKHVFDVAAELAEPLLEVMLQFGRIEASRLALHGGRAAHDGDRELGKRNARLLGKLVEHGRQGSR